MRLAATQVLGCAGPKWCWIWQGVDRRSGNDYNYGEICYWGWENYVNKSKDDIRQTHPASAIWNTGPSISLQFIIQFGIYKLIFDFNLLLCLQNNNLRLCVRTISSGCTVGELRQTEIRIAMPHPRHTDSAGDEIIIIIIISGNINGRLCLLNIDSCLIFIQCSDEVMNRRSDPRDAAAGCVEEPSVD